ncbi:plasmid mobilization relaxosome protein MobC [Brevundimonas subvibrioides]|uniref:plasmid mobilization relaxosome protein MobC n=1 Tax=Brevundimonas subvibrioides TaxID=74313 RepID=UPI001C54F5CD|nr:plasmid mobilization relaxosome protein MobC [Brevundimonas subvibrioides]
MDRITVRLSHDLARKFDASAAARGGRSRLLRRLIQEAAHAHLPDADGGAVERLTGRLALRLGDRDLARLEQEAGRLGVSRTQWAVRLIRGRLTGRPQPTPPEATALIEIRRELRRIGVNVNRLLAPSMSPSWKGASCRRNSRSWRLSQARSVTRSLASTRPFD